jgi:hypothetical protein
MAYGLPRQSTALDGAACSLRCAAAGPPSAGLRPTRGPNGEGKRRLVQALAHGYTVHVPATCALLAQQNLMFELELCFLRLASALAHACEGIARFAPPTTGAPRTAKSHVRARTLFSAVRALFCRVNAPRAPKPMFELELCFLATHALFPRECASRTKLRCSNSNFLFRCEGSQRARRVVGPPRWRFRASAWWARARGAERQWSEHARRDATDRVGASRKTLGDSGGDAHAVEGSADDAPGVAPALTRRV